MLTRAQVDLLLPLASYPDVNSVVLNNKIVGVYAALRMMIDTDAALRAKNERLNSEKQYLASRIDAQETAINQVASLTAQLAARTGWQKCSAHGPSDADVAWGCPSCVRDLRQQLAASEQALNTIRADAQRLVYKNQDLTARIENMQLDTTVDVQRMAQAIATIQSLKEQLAASHATAAAQRAKREERRDGTAIARG